MNIDYQISNTIIARLFLHYDHYSQFLYSRNIDYLTGVISKYAIVFGNETYIITDEHVQLCEYFHKLINVDNDPMRVVNIENDNDIILKTINIHEKYIVKLRHSVEEQAFDLIMKIIYGFKEVAIPRQYLIDAFFIIEELMLKVESNKAYNQNIKQEFLCAIQVPLDYTEDECKRIFRFGIDYKMNDLMKWYLSIYGLNNFILDDIINSFSDYQQCCYFLNQIATYKEEIIKAQGYALSPKQLFPQAKPEISNTPSGYTFGNEFPTIDKIFSYYTKCCEKFLKDDDLLNKVKVINEAIIQYQHDIPQHYAVFFMILIEYIKVLESRQMQTEGNKDHLKHESVCGNGCTGDVSSDYHEQQQHGQNQGEDSECDSGINFLKDLNKKLETDYNELCKSYEKRCIEANRLAEINWKLKEENNKLIKKNNELMKKLKEIEGFTSAIRNDESRDIQQTYSEKISILQDLSSLDHEPISPFSYEKKVPSLNMKSLRNLQTPNKEKSLDKSFESDKSKSLISNHNIKDYSDTPPRKISAEELLLINQKQNAREKSHFRNLKTITGTQATQPLSLSNSDIAVYEMLLTSDSTKNPLEKSSTVGTSNGAGAGGMSGSNGGAGGVSNTGGTTSTGGGNGNGGGSGSHGSPEGLGIIYEKLSQDENRGRPANYYIARPILEKKTSSKRGIEDQQQDNSKVNQSFGSGTSSLHMEKTPKQRYLSSSPTVVKDLQGANKLSAKIQDFVVSHFDKSEDISMDTLKKEISLMNTALFSFRKIIYLLEYKNDNFASMENIQKAMNMIKTKAYDEICLAIYNEERNDLFILVVIIEVLNKKCIVISPNQSTASNMKMLQCIKHQLREKFSSIPFRHEMHTRFEPIFPIIRLDSLIHLITVWQYKGVVIASKK